MSLWRRQKPVAAAEAVNPYLDLRRSYNDQVSSALSQRFLMATFTLLALLIALASTGGLIHLGSQSKFVPYVVERDKYGNAVAVSQALPAPPLDPETTTLVTQAALAAFFSDARLVTADAAVQVNAIRRVYALIVSEDPAMRRMNEWLNGDPKETAFERATRILVNVEIVSVLQQSPATWQVDWVEHVTDRDGSPREELRMRALATIYRRLPTRETTEEVMRQNPMGIFVKDFSWSRQLR
jgi:type IV secretion system protein TrbF